MRLIIIRALVTFWVLAFLLATGGELPGTTQTTPPPDAARVLVSGVDVNGQGFPISLVSLAEGRADTLATFANRPVCPPTMFPDGSAMLYELVDNAGQPLVYRIDVGSRSRELILEADMQAPLTCPQVAPDGARVAWTQPTVEGGTALVLTDTMLTTPTSLITHPTIYDVRWSPGGAALIYHVIEPMAPFPTLYSLPSQGAPAPRLVFSSENGLLHDYRWTGDGSGLLVAYYTEDTLAVAILSTACVIGPGDPCNIDPFATFPFDAVVNLTSAYSPDDQRIVVVLQSAIAAGAITDLYLLSLDGTTAPQRLTATADIVESDVYWSLSDDAVYFMASRLDAETQTLRGALYRLDLDSNAPPQVVFSSEIFSPAQFLWWYE